MTGTARRSWRGVREVRERRGYPTKLGVEIDHLCRGAQSIVSRGVSGVALLPQKFRSSEEGSRAEFPANYIGPLVDLQRQVAVGVNPLPEGSPHGSLRGRTDDQRLIQSGFFVDRQSVGGSVSLRIVERVGFQAVMSDDSALFGKSLNMRSFLTEERGGDQEREIIILGAGCSNLAI
jgi:hypothetical protein